MLREWVFFDVETVEAAFKAMPPKARAKLASLMEHYREVGLQNPLPAMIDDYGDGIKRLRHIKPAYQGRMLFFAIDRIAGFERLVVLTFFKKESREVPHHILERAKQRKLQYERERN